MKVENVVKVFESAAGRVVALRGINLSIKKGESVAIVNLSGSGKSTLLNIIGALDRPSSGRVFIRSVDIFSLNDSEIVTMGNNYLIGFIFQLYNAINRRPSKERRAFCHPVRHGRRRRGAACQNAP
jgi:putative ABC transport system ATP-binding protein